MKVKRQLLVVAVMLGSIVALGFPGQATTTTKSANDFCSKCEADCYETAENVQDYNACIFLCNYAGDCNLPIIQ